MTSNEVWFALEEGVSALLEGARERFRCRDVEATRVRRVLVDTFDRRLERGGFALVETHLGGRVELLLEALGDGGRGSSPRAAGEAPAYGWELPAGPLRERVEALAGVRRLLPLVRVDARVVGLDVLDDEEKTVCRVRVERAATARPGAGGARVALSDRLVVAGLRGYEAERARVVRWAEEALGRGPARDPHLASALSAVGAPPPVPERPTLDPDEPAGEAIRRVLAWQLARARHHLPGTLEDVDTEFLHDLRVAVRRTRAILGQTADLLGPTARFERELRRLGSATGTVRDLDVLLLDLRGEPELAALVPVVESARAAERRRMVRHLTSPRTAAFLDEWKAFLAAKSEGESTDPIRRVAGERILAALAKLLKRGRKVRAGAPAAALHRVRIQGKKLRYLLDAFGPLADPRSTVREAVRDLKALQDELGAFNDGEVQRETLAGLARRAGDALPAIDGETLLAMGRRQEEGERRGRDVRERAAERLEVLGAKGRRGALRKAFGVPKGGAS